MKFENINQIREQFQLDGNTYKELRSQLKKLLSDKHPDKNGGEFNSEDEKDKFNDIQQALDFLENSTLPVTQNEVTALTKAIAALSTTRNSSETSESLTNRIKHSISSFKKGHLFPKITTTAISIVLSALYINLMNQEIKKGPITAPK